MLIIACKSPDFRQKLYQENINVKSPVFFSRINLSAFQINLFEQRKKMHKKAFEKVDADNGDNSIHVAVNFGASATTEVSTGLVRCHPLRSSILGRCTGSSNLTTVPGDGCTLKVPGLVGR